MDAKWGGGGEGAGVGEKRRGSNIKAKLTRLDMVTY